jgi:arylformamidase
MFIHGGYWRALDKREHAFIAPAFTRAGVTVAVPNYALCPSVSVEDIVRQMLQASAWLYRNGGNFGAPFNQVYVAGHSAGGHLTAMMLAALWPVFAADLPPRTVAAGFSISGVYDLAPLMQVSINEDVRLTPASARKLSPAFMPPATDAPLYTAVGERENAGFHLQDGLIRRRWKKVHRGPLVVPGANHFTVLDHLADSGSRLHQAVLGMMGLGASGGAG